jgi:ribosomal-protein-alanine N-acetyltransferase
MSSPADAAEPCCHPRWMVRRDLPAVLAIERTTRGPWSEADFVRRLRHGDNPGMVAEIDGRIVGHMVYRFYDDHINIQRLVVDPNCRRRGVEEEMLDALLREISNKNKTRRYLTFAINETELPTQLILRAKGFQATGVRRGHFKQTGDDAYLMLYDRQEHERPSHHSLRR